VIIIFLDAKEAVELDFCHILAKFKNKFKKFKLYFKIGVS
jgi:hypothetical protein